MSFDHEHNNRYETITQAEKEDLLGLVQMRFGQIPEDIQKKIMHLNDPDVLNRLFLVAVNAANWHVFVSELNEGKDAFKMVGDGFDPLAERNRRGET
ncbi:MAG TPA: hypothetical protein VK136_07210 [Bacillota bacterium]|nr:hypothetical protein [Bacillota bacterium]